MILALFAVAPALWKVATYLIERSDGRRKEYKDLLNAKDDRINELYDRLLTESVESREALATAAKTLEGFVEKENSLEARLDAIKADLAVVVEYVRRKDAA